MAARTVHRGCFICGVIPRPDPHDWRYSIRAVYTTFKLRIDPMPNTSNASNERTPPRLSETGISLGGGYFVPSALEDQPHTIPHHPQMIEIRDVKRLGDDSYEDPRTIGRGYIVHEACWHLFEKVRSPQEIDHVVLYNLLASSFHFGHFVDWGHTYGGLCVRKKARLEIRRADHAWTPWSAQHLTVRKKVSWLNAFPNPLWGHKCEDLVRLSTRERETCGTILGFERCVSSRLQSSERDGADIFWKLPVEIREQILMFSASSDVCSLRLASRPMASLPLTQSFWISRFNGTGEFSHIFEARGPLKPGYFIDWKELYNELKKLWLFLGLTNRRRIWSLLQRLDIHMSPYVGVSCEGESDESESFSWEIIAADIKETQTCVTPSTTLLTTRWVKPSDTVGVYVSMNHGYPIQYVTGLRFISKDGSALSLGYILKGNEVYADLSKGDHDSSDLDDDQEDEQKIGLCGFSLSVMKWGITGIEFITNAGTHIRCSGRDACKLKEWRTVTLASGTAGIFGAQFDGCKMLSLGIGR